MEKNDDNIIEGQKVEGSSNKYTTVSEFSSKKKTSNLNFWKQVFIPFLSGVVGAGLVVGVCLGIPQIKNSTSTNNNSGTNSISNNITNGTISAVSLENFSDTSMKVANKVLPSVVGIKVEYSVSSIFYRNMSSTATAEGSGVIIREDGYILTNNHIVNSSSSSSYYEVGKANKVTVYLYNDETEYEATIVGTDEETDLAVLKIDKTGLTAATLGNSDDVKVGEFAMAIGNPLDMRNTVTSGIISGINREIEDDNGTMYTLIQTDAAINAGNSGGALVNAEGKLIGINTLKMSGTGIEGMGFAIPINSTLDISEQLISTGKVKRPYIGISGTDVNETLSEYYNIPVGVYVRSIQSDGPAKSSDLKPGDVIVKFNGEKIETMSQLNKKKNECKIGDEVTLTVSRGGNEVDVKVTLTEQP